MTIFYFPEFKILPVAAIITYYMICVCVSMCCCLYLLRVFLTFNYRPQEKVMFSEPPVILSMEGGGGL